MSAGLPVSRLVSASVNLSPSGAQAANLNSLLILGSSDVIDVSQRIRSYAELAEVATDFGTSATEYLAASLFFSQAPRPTQLYIGKWASADVAGRLIGAALTAAEKLLTNFTAVTNGSLKLAIDGASAVTLSSMNFSGAANLNAVAAIIDAALTGATCIWDGQHFVIQSESTGASSSIGYPTAPASGTDMKALLGLTAAQGARKVDGIAAETALEAVTLFDGLPTSWYGLMFASASIVDADHIAVAAYIEATQHIYGLTTQAAGSIDSTSTSDIGYLLKAAGYDRTFGQYSTSSPYAVASMFGRILTTDFEANASVITLMFKDQPGITAESLTTTQANALDARRLNYFANFSNDTAIIVNGWTFGDAYIDEIYGSDWLSSDIQTEVYNLLYTSTTKIPQTDAGNALIAAAIEATCARGVTNGLLAPGTWTVGGFGALGQGDYLPAGFYVYAPPIALQTSADRAARQSVTFQIAAKLAGAIHDVNVLISVNR